jgi:hypothetical protein
MSDNEKMGTADRGYVAVGRAASRPTTEEEIQRGIDATMRAVSADRYSATINRPKSETVRVANAPKVVDADAKRGSGWQEEKPLGPVVKSGSMEERAMSQMIDAALPPGGEKKDRK